MQGKLQRIRARILVKAYPQPSHKYEETVCVAAISEDGNEMLRLYPIRYRHLPRDRKFDRFDLVEMDVEKPIGDPRPESRHVVEDSISIISAGDLRSEQKVKLWSKFIVPSLTALYTENKATRRSFGIVRPDPGSMRFFVKLLKETNEQEQALSVSVFNQQSLLGDSLKPLAKPEYSFGYRYTSGRHSHTHLLQDWEVQAAYLNFVRLYGDHALDHLKEVYGEKIPAANPHFIMGTMKAHPNTFIVVGVLRSSLDPGEVTKQGSLF